MVFPSMLLFKSISRCLSAIGRSKLFLSFQMEWEDSVSKEFRNPLNIDGACAAYQPGYLVPKILMPDDTSEEAFKDSACATRRITVYALEGAHGVGKTTLSKILDKLYFHVVEEDFIDVFSNFILPGDESHNCMVEIAWASMQIINLVNMANNIRREMMMDPTANDCFFLDRCFLTGSVYGVMSDEMRTWYLKIFKDVIESMRDHYNIDFKVIRLKAVSEEDNFAHIQKRMEINEDQKLRKELKEDQIEHLRAVNDGYDKLEKEGYIDYVFPVQYADPLYDDGEEEIAFPIGRFFETIKLDRMLDHYKGISILYNPKEDGLCGIKKDDEDSK